MNARILAFFLNSLDVTNLIIHYKNNMQTLIGIPCGSTVYKSHVCPIISWLEDWYCLHSSQLYKWKQMWDKRNSRYSYRKGKLAGWHEHNKNISSKKLRIKTNFDNLQVFWRIIQVLWSVMQFQMLFYLLP